VTRYLSAPVVPTYLGFDPRLQFVHETDGIEALLAAIRNPVRGAVNVAAPGTVGLTKMLRLAGKLSVPVAAAAFPMTQRVGLRIGMPAISPDFGRLLRYGRAVDVSRLVEEVGYMPRYTATETIEDYVGHQQGRRLVPSLRDLAVGV
jgi:UDP-glucose 4-epimerase